MIKKILILILLISLPSLGFADVCTEGSGTDTCTVCSSACDYTQAEFEALSGDYSNDTFYFSLSFTSTIDVGISGTSGNPVTIDGWEGGTCDPPNEPCTSACNIATQFYLNGNDYVTIQDFDRSAGGRFVYSADNTLSTGITIRNNTMARSTLGWIYLPYTSFSVIKNNRINSNRISGVGQSIEFGGHDNHIINNYIDGGITGILSKMNRSTNNEGHHYNNVIAGNTVIDYKEEGISFDGAPNSASYTAAVDYDTVLSSTSSTVTLNDADWSGESDSWNGYYLIFISGGLIGEYFLITDQTNAIFTVDGNPSAASNGDKIVIGLLYRSNYIGFNTVTRNAVEGCDSDGILLYGLSFHNIVEGNTTTRSNMNSRSLGDVKQSSDTITGNCAGAPNGTNLFKDNTAVAGGCPVHTGGSNQFEYYNVAQCGGGSSPSYVTKGNTSLDNALDGQFRAEYQYYYANGNTGSESIVSSIESASYAYDLPYITGTPSVASNGGSVTITFSEPVDLSGYTTGDAWVEKADETKINLAYSSGDDTATIVFTAASTIDTGETWYFWFDGTDDSIQDTDDGNDLVVYGFKPVTIADGDPPILVTVAATDSSAEESGTTTGEWTISCNPECSSTAITYALSGVAVGGTSCTAGVDYSITSLTTITITGASGAVTITSCDDSDVESYEEIATLTVTEEAAYDVGSPASGNISIYSDDAGMPIYDYGKNVIRGKMR